MTACLVRYHNRKSEPSTKHPVFATLTLETLQKLNAAIAVDGQEAGAVAVSYLQSKNFLP